MPRTVKRRAPTPRPSWPSPSAVSSWRLRSTPCTESNPAHVSAKPAELIYIVEDDPAVARLISSTLEKFAYRWELFPTGGAFLRAFRGRMPALLGEYMFGAGRGSRYMVYLTVSTGIGGGVIINGKILEGANGTAGEIGHTTIDWKGGRCNCGNIGCLEYLASGTAIARYANDAIAAGQGTDLLAFASTMLEHIATVPDQQAIPSH